jgi:carbon monoxide dehydrogenase subunit G
MASIIMDEIIAAPVERVWAALSDFAAADRVFTGVLTACALESDDVRSVTFANGMVARERLVGIDHDRRRFAYSVLNFAHHNASFEVTPHPEGARVSWVCDVLPHEAAAQIHPLMQAGFAAMKRSLGG